MFLYLLVNGYIALCLKLHRNINYKKYYSVDLIPIWKDIWCLPYLRVWFKQVILFTIKIPQVFICDLLATDCRPLRFAYRTINYHFFVAYNASYANLMQMKHCCYFIQIILIISYVRMRIINNFFFLLTETFLVCYWIVFNSCTYLHIFAVLIM